jgi:diguanylate cyclase (GGDEF)-like protein
MSKPPFEFAEHFGDARVEELKLLSWVARHGSLWFNTEPSVAWQDLLVALVSGELLTTFRLQLARFGWADSPNPSPDVVGSSGMPGESNLERAMVIAKLRAVHALYENRCPERFRLTHAGRVRLSELKQAIRSGREREPFGILWDVRHWEQDLQVAILDVNEDTPLALAYLDMNGLKQVNDTYGHDAGDLALRTYFQAVASALGDRGQAYRLGGDEVLVVMPDQSQLIAGRVLEFACNKLMSERLWRSDLNAVLSIAAGIIVCTDPTASPANLRSSADREQKRAKERSKQGTPRPSVIAINGQPDLLVIEHTTGPSSS